MYPRSLLMDRRNFLVAATASLLCAPAIVRAWSPMPIKVVDWTPVPVPANEICEGGELSRWSTRTGADARRDYIRKAPADVVTPVRTKAAAALECLHALQGRNIRKSP